MQTGVGRRATLKADDNNAALAGELAITLE